jgi:4-hydroxy-tetrahydrodipicolinate synthase
MPAVLTPYDPDGRLAPERWREYLPWLESQGVDGLFLFGTTGEGLTLTVAEREEGLEAALSIATVPVVVQVGAMNVADTRRLLAHAADAGAAAAAIVSPSYYRHDADALVRYYAALAERTRLPLVLYNIPSHAASDVTPEVAARIRAEAPAYVAIKDSSRQPNRLPLYRAAGLSVYVGAESLVQMSTLLGEGSITAIAAAFPDLIVPVVREAATARGAALQQQVVELHAKLPPLTVPALRAVLARRGFDLGPPRLPFRPLTEAETRQALATLEMVPA